MTTTIRNLRRPAGRPRHEQARADAALGGKLADLLRSLRAQGASYPVIADIIRDTTGVNVGAHTCANWHAEYTNGRRNGLRGK